MNGPHLPADRHPHSPHDAAAAEGRATAAPSTDCRPANAPPPLHAAFLSALLWGDPRLLPGHVSGTRGPCLLAEHALSAAGPCCSGDSLPTPAPRLAAARRPLTLHPLRPHRGPKTAPRAPRQPLANVTPPSPRPLCRASPPADPAGQASILPPAHRPAAGMC